MAKSEMVEITIDIPESLREKLKKNRINMALALARAVKQIEEENEMTDWSVKLQHASRKGRLIQLKKKDYYELFLQF